MIKNIEFGSVFCEELYWSQISEVIVDKSLLSKLETVTSKVNPFIRLPDTFGVSRVRG